MDVLVDLFARLEAPEGGVALVTYEETTTWPGGTLHNLGSLGLLERGPNSQEADCGACLVPHRERVLFADPGARPFIPCELSGRVFVEPAALLRWRSSLELVAKSLARALGTDLTPVEEVSVRLWNLGAREFAGRRCSFYLCRGSSWRDADSRFRRALGDADAVVLLTASVVPSSLQASGELLPAYSLFTSVVGELRFDDAILQASADPGRAPAYSLTRSGRFWDLTFGNVSDRLQHRTGLPLLAVLIANPYREFPALDLLALASGNTAGQLPSTPERVGEQHHQEDTVADSKTIEATQDRIAVLDRKKRQGSISPEEDGELAELRKYLAGAIGIGGRSRRIAGPAEKARTSITTALTRLFATIHEVCPSAASHFRASVETGSRFVYRPTEPLTWTVRAVTKPVTASHVL